MTEARARSRSDYWAFEDSLGYLARLVFRHFSVLRERRTRRHGISAGQWAFLRQLWREDGISQHELSRRLAMRDATTAIALRGLQRAALVRRRVNPRDRRETLVFLTPEARQLKNILLPVTIEVQSLATRGLSQDEVEQLRGLLLRVIDNLSDENPGVVPGITGQSDTASIRNARAAGRASRPCPAWDGP